MKDFRTPLKKVEGLGSAHTGSGHWWHQRLTAIVNLLLFVWFAVSVVTLAGADYRTLVWWVKDPVVTVLLTLLVASVFYHLKLGLQVVIEDYVHDEAWKMTSLLLVSFLSAFFALLGIVMVLKISFGG